MGFISESASCVGAVHGGVTQGNDDSRWIAGKAGAYGILSFGDSAEGEISAAEPPPPRHIAICARGGGGNQPQAVMSSRCLSPGNAAVQDPQIYRLPLSVLTVPCPLTSSLFSQGPPAPSPQRSGLLRFLCSLPRTQPASSLRPAPCLLNWPPMGRLLAGVGTSLPVLRMAPPCGFVLAPPAEPPGGGAAPCGYRRYRYPIATADIAANWTECPNWGGGGAQVTCIGPGSCILGGLITRGLSEGRAVGRGWGAERLRREDHDAGEKLPPASTPPRALCIANPTFFCTSFASPVSLKAAWQRPPAVVCCSHRLRTPTVTRHLYRSMRDSPIR